jgi:hypothetical protein
MVDSLNPQAVISSQLTMGVSRTNISGIDALGHLGGIVVQSWELGGLACRTLIKGYFIKGK